MPRAEPFWGGEDDGSGYCYSFTRWEFGDATGRAEDPEILISEDATGFGRMYDSYMIDEEAGGDGGTSDYADEGSVSSGDGSMSGIGHGSGQTWGDGEGDGTGEGLNNGSDDQ